MGSHAALSPSSASESPPLFNSFAIGSKGVSGKFNSSISSPSGNKLGSKTKKSEFGSFIERGENHGELAMLFLGEAF
jgi:hypothetical protein